jgi:hypothetical protein
MEELFAALSKPLNLAIVQQIAEAPGIDQRELRRRLEIEDTRKGTLSKAVEGLIAVGIIQPSAKGYELAAPEETEFAVATMADLRATLSRRATERAREQQERDEQRAHDLKKAALRRQTVSLDDTAEAS